MPDFELPVAAILVDREYYSFFKAVQEPSKVLAIVAKLGNRGDSTVITTTASGYVIWVFDPEADAVVKPSYRFCVLANFFLFEYVDRTFILNLAG